MRKTGRPVQRLRAIFVGQLMICGLWLIALGACQDAAATAPPVALTPLADLLRPSQPTSDQNVTTFGYVLADQDGGTLVDAVAFDQSGVPRQLDTGVEGVWLGADARARIQAVRRTSGTTEYASVVARGRLSGPGSYGPGGRYRYQLAQFQLEPLAAQETTIAALLARPPAFEGRLVHVAGGLLAHETSALLVERLGAGGLPEPKTQQIKLGTPMRDQAVIARLQATTGGAVHFGQVQLEGLWHSGMLVVVSITNDI